MTDTYMQLLKDQSNFRGINRNLGKNIEAVINYENAVFQVTKNHAEILMAYPHEEDSGIYVVAVNSKIVAVNNRRAIVSFLEKREIAADASIFVHKLGAAIDVNLHQKLVESIAV